MDPELALLTLESELEDEAELSDLEDLHRLGQAVAAAAATQEGYSGLAWKAGAKLLDVAERFGQDTDHLFDTFGWNALANGLQGAIRDKKLLRALSYASVSFLPRSQSPPVFDHPRVVEAIRAGLVATPRPFINLSDLAAADTSVQTQFGELLSRLPDFTLDNELILQWSASALRVLPSQSPYRQVAAINLLHALCGERRFIAAYYAFRALAEQHEDLWRHPIALNVLQSLFDQYWQNEEVGVQVLAQLCADDDVLRRSDQQFDMLVLIGALAISLLHRYGCQGPEVVAWHFVNETYDLSALVAHALGNYLTDGSLPPLPTSRSEWVEALEQEFNQAVRLVENELRPRKYGLLTLAGKIYQSNVREVFTPLLNEIRSERRSSTLVEQIRQTDTEKLVTESEWQKASTYPINGRILRKMVGDNRRILQALECAARKGIELDEARAEWAAQPDDEFKLFHEFRLSIEGLGPTAIWALETLLSDLWMRLQEGVAIAAREEEAKRHAARYC